MARLFVTSKEQSFISDIAKEFNKDIVGQFIIYYPISTLKTQVHAVYDEAIEKIFENPIKIDVLADQENWETKFNQFGNEQAATVEMYIHAKDMIDKGYEITEGDFFLYGDVLFEVINYIQLNNIFGQVDYNLGHKLIGKVSRQGQFDVNTFKQMLKQNNSNYADSSVQKVFQQQRGLPENVDGATGDIREIRDRLGNDMAEVALGEGPRVVNIDLDEKASSFDNNTPNHSDVPDIYNEE